MKDLRILGIDTSGKVASVALLDGEVLMWEKSVYTTLTHSQVILPMVGQALAETGFELADIDCAAVAAGASVVSGSTATTTCSIGISVTTGSAVTGSGVVSSTTAAGAGNSVQPTALQMNSAAIAMQRKVLRFILGSLRFRASMPITFLITCSPFGLRGFPAAHIIKKRTHKLIFIL